MKVLPQAIEEQQGGDLNYRIDFSYRDITAGIANNTAFTLTLFKLLAGDWIMRAELHLTTPFANSTDTGFNSDTFSLGDTASATRYFSGVELNLNGSYVVDSLYNTPYNIAAAALPQDIILTLNSMSGKSLSNLTQGKLWIGLQLYRPGKKVQNLDLTQPPYV